MFNRFARALVYSLISFLALDPAAIVRIPIDDTKKNSYMVSCFTSLTWKTRETTRTKQEFPYNVHKHAQTLFSNV